MNSSPFKLWVIVGSAAPIEVYKSVNLNIIRRRIARGDVAAKKRRLTNSMAVRKMDSARKKMMLQTLVRLERDHRNI
jgi:hypothetical protein